MAEGTQTGEMPSFDPSPGGYEAKKRPSSSDGSELSELCCMSMFVGFGLFWVPEQCGGSGSSLGQSFSLGTKKHGNMILF